MGRAIYSLIMMGALLGLMACGGKDSSEAGGGTMAITPNNADCLNYGPHYTGNGTSTCDPSVYNQYGSGFTSYPTYNNQYGTNYYQDQQNNYSNGFCGCPTNYQPTYHPQWGLGCVQTTYSSSYQYWSYDYSGYSMSQATLNINQTGYYSTPSNNGCYKALTYSCDTRNPGTCGAGGYCRPVSGATTIGVCTFSDYSSPNQGSHGGW